MDDAALARLIDAAYDFACTRRCADFVDVDGLLAAVDVVATAPRLQRLVERFVAPGRARLFDRARASALPFGAWLPEPVQQALAAMLGQPAPIPRPLVDKMVADEHVRESARAMLQEALSAFIHKAFSATPGGRGLRGVIGLGARAAGGLFGGLGEELQRQLEERVRDFVDGGVALLQQRVAQKLTSEETARQLGRRRRRIFLDLMKRPESDLARVTRRVPWPLLDAMVPAIVMHNLARAEVRAALRDEVEAVVRELSAQTLGELLDELGLRDAVRAWLHARALPQLRDFVASPQFPRGS